MAISDAYADAATYRNRISKSDTGADAAILADLTSISRMIEKELDSFFNKDAFAVARDFRPQYSDDALPELKRTLYLDVPIAVAPTGVQTDDNGDGTPETTWAATDYQLEPLSADKGPEARPWTRLYIPEWSTKGVWPRGGLVRITAQYGWPAVPEPIESACIQLTAILRLETPRAEATVSELGQLVQMSPQASGIVERLKNRYARRAGVSL